MDHLPSVTNQSSHDIIEIKYLSELEYDGRDFQTYPLRRGWDLERLKRGDLTEKSPLEMQSLLQSWLYFGLLSQVLGICNPENRYITRSLSGLRLITTKYLPEDIQGWRNSVQVLAEKEKRQYLSKLSSYLKDASLVLRFANHQQNRSYISGATCLSIAILASSLDFMVYTTAAKLGVPHINQRTWPASTLLISRMIKANWCFSEIARFERHSMVSAMYLASTLQRRSSPLGGSHTSCTKEVCIANNYSDNEYRTLHTDEQCCCKPSGPDDENIANILNQGSFPVVQWIRNSRNTEPYLNVLDGCTGTPYVAISHVWSDGLGNVHQNWLFECQLQRLQNYSNNLWESTSYSAQRQPFHDFPLPKKQSSGEGSTLMDMPFWVDTLCIPRQQPLRNIAINQMRAIYENARAVLVLDAELQQISLKLSWEELLLRISFSGWMRRMWTLQEAALARNLYFQMIDGVFPFLNVLTLVQGSISSVSPLLLECGSLVGEIVLSKEMKGATKFGWAWNHLTIRTTSHLKDFPVIFACLLGVNVEPILETPANRRMITLISHISEFPQGILFTRGPRIDKKAYRWVPDLPPVDKICEFSPVHREMSSLIVVLPGFVFRQPLFGRGSILLFEDEDDQRCYILNFSTDGTEVRPCDDNWSEESTRLGLILQSSACHLTSEMQVAALVCINDETADCIKANFACHVLIGYMSQHDIENFSLNDLQHCDRLWAKPMSSTQKWAVN